MFVVSEAAVKRSLNNKFSSDDRHEKVFCLLTQQTDLTPLQRRPTFAPTQNAEKYENENVRRHVNLKMRAFTSRTRRNKYQRIDRFFRGWVGLSAPGRVERNADLESLLEGHGKFSFPSENEDGRCNFIYRARRIDRAFWKIFPIVINERKFSLGNKK